jgi:hypothetical protein
MEGNRMACAATVHPWFRIRLFAVVATAVAALAGCDQRRSVGGVWEIRGVRVVELKWDSTSGRYGPLLDTLVRADTMTYVVLDDAGRVVETIDEMPTRGFATEQSRDGLWLVSVGTTPRTESDSACKTKDFISIADCRGDTLSVLLRRPRDQRGNRVADSVYLARARSVAYWKKANWQLSNIQLGEVARARSRLDSTRTLGVDPAIVTHVRSVGQVLGELDLLYEEMPPTETEPYVVPPPPPPPGAIFPAIRFVRARLTERSSEEDVAAPRARQLMRRLDEIEQNALALWRGEGPLRQRLSAANEHEFPPMGIFAER